MHLTGRVPEDVDHVGRREDDVVGVRPEDALEVVRVPGCDPLLDGLHGGVEVHHRASERSAGGAEPKPGDPQGSGADLVGEDALDGAAQHSGVERLHDDRVDVGPLGEEAVALPVEQ